MYELRKRNETNGEKRSFVTKSVSFQLDYIKSDTLAILTLVIVMMNPLKLSRFVVPKHQKPRFKEVLPERVY